MERNEAIGIIRNHLPHGSFKMLREALETLIPELKESEGDVIRKGLITYFQSFPYQSLASVGINAKDAVAWLEKQGEAFTKKDVDDAWLQGMCDAKHELEKQDESIKIKRGKDYLCIKTHRYANEKWEEGIIYHALEDYALLNQGCAYYCPAWSKEEHNDCFREAELNGLKPKFKVGDWLQYRLAEPFLVDEITEQGYINGNSCLPFEWENEIHLWSIQDAKDGDVLMSRAPFIYGEQLPYGGLSWYNKKFIKASNYVYKDAPVHPATKEQCELLFAKMKEAGYEWDADKKELKKIKQESAWSDEDEERFLSCLKILGTGNIEQPDTINTMWLKSIKNRVQTIAKFVGEEQYMKGVRDSVEDVLKNPEDYGLLPTPS